MNTRDSAIEKAAEWFDRLRHDALDADDVVAWQRWIAKDSTHRQAFDDLQDLWQQLEGADMPEVATPTQMMADRYVADVPVAEWLSRYQLRSSSSQGWNGAWVRAAAMGCVAMGVLLAWRLWPPATESALTVIETTTAQHRDVRLPDGSKLSLGAKSQVWVRFVPGLREIVLDRGEAFFEVEKDPSRPFVVLAGDTSVTAIGTAFNVRKVGARVMVAVSAGSVALSSLEGTMAQTSQRHSGELRLSAGQKAVVDFALDAPHMSRAAPEAASAWRKGRLEYINEPLKYVVADVSRYAGAEIIVADPALGEVPVTGTVHENDVEGWLKSIGEFMPITVDRTVEGQIVLRSKRAGE